MTNAYRPYQLTAGCTMVLHTDRAEPCPSIMLSTCWTMEEKCEKNRGEGWGEGNIPLNRSIISAITYPYISLQAHTKPGIMISITENSLEIILLDWILHLLSRCRSEREGDSYQKDNKANLAALSLLHAHTHTYTLCGLTKLVKDASL